MSRPLAAVLVALAPLALAACGGGDGTATAVDELTVSGAWARPTPAGAANGVVYLTIATPVDDALVAVEVPAELAGSAMVHESSGGDGGGSHEGHGAASGGGGDMVGMVEAGRVDIDAGDTVVLEPGGMHVMLTGLRERLVGGERFTLTLQFEQAGDVAVDVVVADNPPGT